MTHRRGARPTARGVRRQTLWLGGAVSQNALAGAGGASLVFQLNVAALALRPFTVVRLYLEILVTSDQLIATESQLVGVGKAVVGDQASGIGITAVPRPVSDSGSDLWLLQKMVLNDFTFLTASGVDTNAGQQFSLDSKSMRKVELGQDLITVIETDALSDGSLVTMFTRTLIKLH